jgi:MFS family permease
MASYALLLLFLVNVLNYIDRLIVAAVLPLLQSDLHFSDSQAGLLTGLAFAVLYATVGLPLGRFADRGNRRNLISLVVGLWSCATAVCGFAQNFIQFFVARVAVGVGEAGCLPASQSLISDYFPIARRSSALGIQLSGTFVGTLCGLALGGYLGSRYGWRMAFWAIGAPGVLLALIVRLTLREPVRGHFETSAVSPPLRMREALRVLLANGTYVRLVLAYVPMAFGTLGVIQWGPSYFVRYHGTPLAKAGLLFGVSFGVGSLLGTLLGGRIGDRLMRTDPRATLRFCGNVYGFAIFPGLGFILAPTLGVSLGLLFVFSLLTGCAAGPTSAVIQSVTPPALRATATAMNMFVLTLLGAGGGPVAVGIASDLMAPAVGHESLRYALMLPLIMLLLPTFLLYFAARNVTADIARA